MYWVVGEYTQLLQTLIGTVGYQFHTLAVIPLWPCQEKAYITDRSNEGYISANRSLCLDSLRPWAFHTSLYISPLATISFSDARVMGRMLPLSHFLSTVWRERITKAQRPQYAHRCISPYHCVRPLVFPFTRESRDPPTWRVLLRCSGYFRNSSSTSRFGGCLSDTCCRSTRLTTRSNHRQDNEPHGLRGCYQYLLQEGKTFPTCHCKGRVIQNTYNFIWRSIIIVPLFLNTAVLFGTLSI